VNKSRCCDQSVGNEQAVTQKIPFQQFKGTVRNLVGDFQKLITAQELFEVFQLRFVSTTDN